MSSKIFVPSRGLGYVSNHIPLQVRYIKRRRQENLIVTCIGKSFHTYGVNHFGLLSVGALHSSEITCLTGDTYHVYTSCDCKIYAWRRGVELKHTYDGHKDPVHLLLPFGIHLVSIDEGSNLKVWDIKSESLFLELTFNKSLFQITVVLHPSTYLNKILLGSEQGSLQLWNINTSKLIYNFNGWGSGVSCLEQAPAIDVVAVGLKDGRIFLHNLKFDETVMQFIQDLGKICSISFRSDGMPLMATGSMCGRITFWNLEEKRVSSQLLHAHNNSVTGMAFLSNEPLMVTSSPDNTLKLWIFDMTDGGARLLRIREGHSAAPTHVRYYGSDGNNILSAARDSSLRIFNTKNEQFNKSLGRASYNRKVSKKMHQNNDTLVMPPIVSFMSETTREKEWDNVVAVHSGLPVVTTWSYDRLKMGEKKLLLGQPSEQDLQAIPELQFTDGIIANCVFLTACGNFVLVGYSNGIVARFNIQSGKWRGKYGGVRAHTGQVYGVASDSLNKYVISGGSDCCVKFWTFANGVRPSSTIHLEESVNFFRSHPENSMLAVVTHDFVIRVIDIDTKTVIRKFVGNTSPITDAAFTHDCRWLLTASLDCTIRTWDVPSAQLIDQFKTPSACVSLDLSSDSLVTAHVDYLGVFLWCNRTLYQNVSLRSLNVWEEIPTVALPECRNVSPHPSDVAPYDDDFFKSPQQISDELITLSGLPSSRWQNLLNIDVIRLKNKPKVFLKTEKSAPFFLPTIPSISLKFDLTTVINDKTESKLQTSSLQNLTEFGKILDACKDFRMAIGKLKSFGPSMVDFEIKSLGPDGGGSSDLMIQFLKCVEFMLKSNNDFELAQAYLGVFIKEHGNYVANEERLRNYIPNVQSCLTVAWNRIQDKFLYNLCIVQNLKNQI